MQIHPKVEDTRFDLVGNVGRRHAMKKTADWFFLFAFVSTTTTTYSNKLLLTGYDSPLLTDHEDRCFGSIYA
jgi:hypothetical protein